jgi:hypothetical protein
MARTVRIRGIQNSHCQDSWSTIGPPTTMPTPPPMPNSADMRATAMLTFARGSSSRMIAIDSGTTAPAAPCSARPVMRRPIVGARAEITLPMARHARETSVSRRLPNMSPSRPAIGVATDATSRYTVITHATSPPDDSKSRAIAGRAGATIDCRSANDRPASDNDVSTRAGRTRGASAPFVGDAGPFGGATVAGDALGTCVDLVMQSSGVRGCAMSAPVDFTLWRLRGRVNRR